MKLLYQAFGTLKMDVSSEGIHISKGTDVVVSKVAENRQIYVEVKSKDKIVHLNSFDTNLEWLL